MTRIAINSFILATLLAAVLLQNSELRASQFVQKTYQAKPTKKRQLAKIRYTVLDPQMVNLALPVIEPLKPAIVVLKRGGLKIGMGIVISEDGMILTKLSNLRLGYSVEIGNAVFKGGPTIGTMPEADLAVVKVAANGLKVAKFYDVAPEKGDWLITPVSYRTAAAIGVMSENVHQPKQPDGFLGVSTYNAKLEDGSLAVTVAHITPNSAAALHKIRRDDIIKAVGDSGIESSTDLLKTLAKLSRFDLVTILLVRNGVEISKEIVLGGHPRSGNKPHFEMVFGHDTKIRDDKYCGGPILNLEGQIVGINVSANQRKIVNDTLSIAISRRKSTSLAKAVPSSYINKHLKDLTSGKLAPSIVNRHLFEQNAEQRRLLETEIAELLTKTNQFKIDSLRPDFLELSEEKRTELTNQNQKDRSKYRASFKKLKRLESARLNLELGKQPQDLNARLINSR